MTTIRNFEELESWKKARELAGYVYSLTRKEKFAKDFGLRNQIQEAAGSVMHNIAEGFEAGYDAEFIRFLKMARRSAPLLKCNQNFIWRSMRVTSTKKNERKHIALPSKQKNSSMD